MRTAVGSEGPHDVGHIFQAEFLRCAEIFEAGIDFRTALLGLHERLALGFRKQHGAAKIDQGGLGTVFVIDGLHGPLHHRDLVNGDLLADGQGRARDQNDQ